MSAPGIQVPTTTKNSLKAAVLYEDGVSENVKSVEILKCADSEEDNSFCSLTSQNEQKPFSLNDESRQKVPLESAEHYSRNVAEITEENLQTLACVENSSVTQISPGLSLLQQTAAASSPPPHSYRHSRAYRHFKNPPQPHMCIRTTTEAGDELFINVLSWTRIVIPQEPSDPIPLYGGMRVPPGSPRSPPIVFAVMANPEVLKDSGRHSKDPEERRAMVELMCDFVEAMNPGVKLVRNAVILKDRDISGELKDVWNAVQAQRDREREEQILLQRQQHQQHFHNLTNASTNGSLILSLSNTNSADNVTATTDQKFSRSLVSGTALDDGPSLTLDGGTPPRGRKIIREVQNDTNGKDIEGDIELARINNCQVQLGLLADQLDNKISIVGEQSEECKMTLDNNQHTLTNNTLSNGSNSKVSLEKDKNCKTGINNQLNAINCNKDVKKQQTVLTNGCAANANDADMLHASKLTAATSTPNAATTIPAQKPPTSNIPSAVQQAPSKREKLGGFLPNGCIFPRFTKNNKHKDKDKDKDKEPKTKEKEKNALLSALKKSKEKKTNSTTNTAASAATSNQEEKNTSLNSNTTAINYNQSNNKQQKSCLQQLECGVQKLDVNNHHNHNNIAENNINNSATNITKNTNATSKNTTNTTGNNGAGGVSVH